jgi:glycosyltransferase involved in cell wall biosynthesis
MRVSFLMLGKKDFLSGGYIFNRRMVRRLEEEGAEVDILHFRTVPVGLPCRTLRANLYVRRRILGFHPDVVVVSKSYRYAGLFRMLRRKIAVPVVYLMHNMEWMETHGRFARSAYRGYVRWLLGMADAVWVNSKCTARGVVAAGIPPERIHRIPPGFDKGPEPLPDRASRPGPVRLLCVGAIAPGKAQDILLQACARLDSGSFHLEFAGNMDGTDGYSTRIREMAAAPGLLDSVELMGPVPQEDLAAVYDRADILVHPARWESFGMAVAEGMWRGLPVVASDVAALPELVRHGINGLLVPPGDPATLATSLAGLIDDPGMRLRMGRESRRAAEGMNDWEDTGRAFFDLVRRTAGDGQHA